MKTTTKLNQNETLVLKACLDEIIHCTADEFGVTNSIKVNELAPNQIKGYLSQLQKKGVISIWHFAKNENQDDTFRLTESGVDFLMGLEEMELRLDLIESLIDIKNNL